VLNDLQSICQHALRQPGTIPPYQDGKEFRMQPERLGRVAFVIAALHVLVLSIIFGPRHIGYILAGTLSATLIWGVVFVLDSQKRRAGVIAGVIAGLVVQQVAYQVWKAELSGFGWPLAQFGALQFLLGYVIGRCAP